MKIKRKQVGTESGEEFLYCRLEVVAKKLIQAKISLFLNPYHKIDERQALTIGEFECVEDYEVFKFLMDEVLLEASKLECSFLLGPMDGSTWNTYRLVTSPQEDPFLLELVTPGYYIDLFRNYGFETYASYLSTKTNVLVDNWDKLEGRFETFKKIGVVFEPFDKENAIHEFKAIGELCLTAFADNILYSPINIDVFVKKMMLLLPLINPRYTIVAKHKSKTVGFIFCYQDINDKKEKTIVVKTLARDFASAYKGIGSLLASIAMRNAIADGFINGIHALMNNANTSTYISSSFKSKFLRSYELMIYKVES